MDCETAAADHPQGLAARVRAAPPRALAFGLGGLATYLAVMRLAQGENRLEQLLVCAAMIPLLVWSDGTRRFLAGMLPFLLFGIVYDLTHLTEPYFRYLHIHIEEPYWFDKTFFGIRVGDEVLTPNELFRRHHWPFVDFWAGLSYIVFVYWAIGFAAWLALFRRDPRGQQLLRRFGWTFLLMNVVGFATYYVYPAAPPWYVAAHGFGPPDFSVTSSAAAAARWDELTGIPYFAGFYGRSADVFGAIPSLHVSYPLLTFLFGMELRKRWLDVASFGLFALVSFSAVYLDHHYVLDVLLGVLYTVTAWGIDRLIQRRRGALAPAPPSTARTARSRP
jgi:hypothetical protein